MGKSSDEEFRKFAEAARDDYSAAVSEQILADYEIFKALIPKDCKPPRFPELTESEKALSAYQASVRELFGKLFDEFPELEPEREDPDW